MDTDLLVDKVEEGELLIRELIRAHFDVTAAFWVKLPDSGVWHLYIASSTFDRDKPNLATRVVYAAIDKVPKCSIAPLEITLIPNADPISRDAVLLRDRFPSRVPKVFHRRRLGNLDTEEICVYPRRLPLKLRQLSNGQWQVQISEFDDIWFTCATEDDARTISDSPVLESEASRLKAGDTFAAELTKTANVMQKYGMVVGSAYFDDLAQKLPKR